jgi:hypothetical protein
LVEFEYGGEILAWVALLILLSAVQQLFLIYACMTVSQIAPRFRGFIGFAVYLVVLLLVEAPLNTLAFDALAIDTLSINALSEEMLSGAAINVLMTEVMLKSWIMAVIQAVFAAVYFIAAVKLLEHTFNLE